jgi:deoxyuridine 5'-triphosphate nucleotidohydrolase
MNDDETEVFVHVLPGGIMPQRQTDGAVGYDVCVRAVVDSFQMDDKNPNLRKCLFDFFTIPDDLAISSHVGFRPKHGVNQDGSVIDNQFELTWRVDPHDRVLVGIGIALGMPVQMYQWLTPRSGLSSKYGVSLGNAPGTVDSDYRGEAGLIVVNTGETPIFLTHGMRIAQTLFQRVYIPKLTEVVSLGM